MDAEHTLPVYLLFFVPVAMVLTVPVRLLIMRFNCVFPQTLFIGCFGAITGFIMILIEGMDFEGISKIQPDVMLSTVLNIYIVSVLYRIDYNIFKRCILQCLLIVCFKLLVQVVCIGAIFKYILESSWSIEISLVAALTCVSSQPSNIILLLKELGSHKFLGTILETESILGIIPCFIMFDFLNDIGITYKEIVWYEVIKTVVLSLVGGFAFGCILGKINAVIMCWIYNKPTGSLMVFIATTFFSMFLCSNVLNISGPLAVITIVCFVVNSKHLFSPEVDICIEKFWLNLYYIADNLVIFIVTCEMTKEINSNSSIKDIYDIVILYFCSNISRMIYFQLVRFPMLKMAYKIDMKCSLVLGWSGVKGSLNLLAALVMYQEAKFNTINIRHVRAFLTELTVYVYLTLLINSTSMKAVLRLTGLSELSSARRSNMNNCVRFVMDKRYSTINMLKLNRYLSDANWSIVIDQTVMKHPYRIKLADDLSDDEEEEDSLWNISSAICPICYREVSFEMTERELMEILREAQIKVIKAKKVSIIKQYETGIINRNSLEVLIHLFEIMIESNQEDNAVNLTKYLRENAVLLMISKVLQKLETHRLIEPPKGSQLQKLCYYLFMHVAYDYVVYVFRMLYFCLNLFYLLGYNVPILHKFGVVVLNIIFFIDFNIKFVGYGQNLLALKTYIKFFWNVIDIALLIVGVIDVVLLLSKIRVGPNVYRNIKILGCLQCVKTIAIFQATYKKLISLIDKRWDKKCATGYDLATALVNCSDEILDLIMQIIEVQKIREIYMKRILREREDLVKMMDSVQKHRPWVAITMKTKQVIRIALNSMEESLNQLKFSGFVDNIEYSTIYKEIYEKQKFLRNLQYVQPLPPKIIFTEVPWMANDDATLDFLYNSVNVKEWDVGDVICKSGKKLPGIIIVVTGLLKIKYYPKIPVIERFDNIGQLPIIDYLSTLDLSNEFEDTIMCGASIGELSLLTNRPYDCELIADAPGQAYVLTTEKVLEAMKLRADPTNGLESKLWKHAVLNIAIAVLNNTAGYEQWSREQIKLKLRSAFIPILRCYKMFFVLSEFMEDVILIEGVAADYDSGDILVAPILIPRTIKRIILPRSDLYDVECSITILLIIPVNAASPHSVMEHEEEVAELISTASSSCLLHSDHQKKTKTTHRVVQHKKSTLLLPADDETNLFDTLTRNLVEAKEREQVRQILTKKPETSSTGSLL